MVDNIQKKKIEYTALSDTLYAAARERQSLISKIQSIRGRIHEIKNNSNETDISTRKNFQEIDKAIETASWRLNEANKFLVEKKADYEKLKREMEKVKVSVNSRQVLAPKDDDDDETVTTIRELKKKMERLRSHQLLNQSKSLDRSLGNGKKSAGDELELIGLESRAKNLQELLRQRQNERQELELQLQSLKKSNQVIENRNNAMIRRLDVQIADAMRKNQSSRERASTLVHEVENLKREISRYEEAEAASTIW